MGRPWWTVRRSLWWALATVCAAPGAIWFNPEFRGALVTALAEPFVEMGQWLRPDLLAVLAGSVGGGLLIGWLLRRVRAWRLPEETGQVQTA